MGARNNRGKFECQLSHAEVAEILTERGYPMTAKIAWHLEHQALAKLASDPELLQLAVDLGILPESAAAEPY